MTNLSKKQQQVLQIISSFTEANGYAPTYREIMQILGLSSVATVHKHIQNLKNQGFLEGEKHKWRAVKNNQEIAHRTSGIVSIPLIGSIARGKKMEILAKISLQEVPEAMAPKHLTCYGFSVQDSSFASDHILKGDLLIVEARDEPKEGELLLLSTEDRGTQIAYYHANNLFESSPHIQGIIIGLLRQFT